MVRKLIGNGIKILVAIHCIDIETVPAIGHDNNEWLPVDIPLDTRPTLPNRVVVAVTVKQQHAVVRSRHTSVWMDHIRTHRLTKDV